MSTFLVPLRLLLALTVVTGLLYPAVVTLLARGLFPRQAGGSLVVRNERIVGSELLAQRFSERRFIWPRPSAGDDGTNLVTVPSSASNLGPSHPNLHRQVRARARAWRLAHGRESNAPVPAELLLASGSGLDPHLGPDAVRAQLDRVAAARGWSAEQRRRAATLVEQLTEPPQLGLLGEPRVNVLRLNLALDTVEAPAP